MKKIRWFVGNFEEVIMMALLAMILAIMFGQVIMRYVFSAALSWSEEASRYLFIWLAFLGISYGIKTKSHLRVDLLETFVPGLKKPLEVFVDLVFLVFCVYMVRPGYEMVIFLRNTGQTSPAVGIPMYVVYLSLLCGYILAIARLVEKYALKLLKPDAESKSL